MMAIPAITLIVVLIPCLTPSSACVSCPLIPLRAGGGNRIVLAWGRGRKVGNGIGACFASLEFPKIGPHKSQRAETLVKITGIRTLFVNAQMCNWIFLKVETDQPDVFGWGEATLELKTPAVVGCAEDCSGW
jgi:hypothetical protein